MAEKCICTCVQVDLNTFLTLGDRDLKELGVLTFGARKKMLLAIAGMIQYMSTINMSGLGPDNVSSFTDVQGRPLALHRIDSSRTVGNAIHSGLNKYPYDHTVGSRRDMMSMSGRW